MLNECRKLFQPSLRSSRYSMGFPKISTSLVLSRSVKLRLPCIFAETVDYDDPKHFASALYERNFASNSLNKFLNGLYLGFACLISAAISC